MVATTHGAHTARLHGGTGALALHAYTHAQSEAWSGVAIVWGCMRSVGDAPTARPLCVS
jgi:hypothetical protein